MGFTPQERDQDVKTFSNIMLDGGMRQPVPDAQGFWEVGLARVNIQPDSFLRGPALLL